MNKICTKQIGASKEARFLFQIMLKMRSVAGLRPPTCLECYTPDSLVGFEAKKLFKCSSYFFTVPKEYYWQAMDAFQELFY